MRQIFFDTETTGLQAEGGDRVIEVGCVEMINRQLTGNNLHLYINPERASHEDALRVHGLTEAFLADKPKFAEVAEELLEFLAGAELVIHNAPFDIGFVNAELKRLRKPPITDIVGGVRDTLLMAREMFPGKANSLDALCRRLEVDNSGRTLHGALLDAELLADVYINMTRGQDALLIDDAGSDSNSAEFKLAAVDLRSFQLPVLRADEAELAAHTKVLGELDKSSGGKRVWQDGA
ncbi:DNA polymerase III subunit epsilon [Paucibacter sp. DJ2R-2]|jgi:DNA polymerase-3 subunit epsilon|uniref:DNA polymerase III subunit epsilon n=1 Tax=Paucibacter sp. DJ2R-2 TaxID=2893558 RepID=UPI0021E43D09|nr:DNA polymerase III subunit epsilon [Paucibacter sp. DJ2R-2]MCV2423531.1 DNA polymerase III subunit epsilon [Paucibacter sp. DJ4R-1]MCV2440583.1 DNA polymerase III subunit epsilon [Paucibacter sp. DJ2R-2]